MVAGLGGTALAGLWLFTNHVYSYQNENLFQANPLSLVAAVMILAALTRRGSSGSGAIVRRWTSRLAWTVAGIAFIGLVLKLLPSIYQVNGEIIAVTLPSHLGVALSLRRQTLFPVGTRRRRAPRP